MAQRQKLRLDRIVSMAQRTVAFRVFLAAGMLLTALLIMFTVVGHIWNVCYVAPSGYSLYVGKGYVEYGYGWGWIRRRMFHDGGPELGWTLKRTLPTSKHDRVRAEWRIQIWHCLVTVALLTLCIWRRGRLFGLPEPRYLVATIPWGVAVLALVTIQGLRPILESIFHDHLAFAAFGLSVLITVPPVITVRLLERLVRRFRIPPGYCRKCLYDLTGNVSGICPECGTPVSKDTDLPRAGS